MSDNPGSSPHTRGTAFSAYTVKLYPRFIPAHAGNRQDLNRANPVFPVHPRTRGEQRRPDMMRLSRGGSSPHTRGTEPLAPEVQHLVRFIPAHAGNRAVVFGHSWCVSVHPRTRGEQPEYTAHRPEWDGSSPHTRGTVRVPRGARVLRRFIPAHAGNRCFQGAEVVHVRFIPAHAGNRPARTFSSNLSSVHPRTRGEQTKP